MTNMNATPSTNESVSHKLMTTSAAAYLTAAIAPGVYDFTIPWAVKVFTGIYGPEAADPTMIAHGVLVGLLTFIGLKNSIAMTLTLMSVAVARYGWRFMAL